MSVLIFIDIAEGKIKKASFEAANYGAAIANQMGTDVAAIVLGVCTEDMSILGNYGVSKVYHNADSGLNVFDAKVYAQAIADATDSIGSNIIIFSNTITGKALAPRVSVRLKAGLVSGAVALPDTSNGFVVRKSVFSGKAFANVAIQTDKKIISLNPNAFSITKSENSATVESITLQIQPTKIELVSINKITGDVPLGEADIVVSGGRGLKGPENWGLVTDLAQLLGAATACSRPVADIHWRPHHEHVGQTGLAIAPNLYIAIGISGAIQHLAGVNRSKTIVVINKDPEAPFFKAADYGIVGDAFEVVPKIIEAVKKLKGSV
jgi:electron transfer flavoprotein alpha subunit